MQITKPADERLFVDAVPKTVLILQQSQLIWPIIPRNIAERLTRPFGVGTNSTILNMRDSGNGSGA
jgi:hypothetical protein